MKRLLPLVLVLLVVVFCAGCGNVTLRGDAMTAAQNSACHAAAAVNRANLDANASPWIKAYLQENAGQWRSFVRSANKDPNWLPDVNN